MQFMFVCTGVLILCFAFFLFAISYAMWVVAISKAQKSKEFVLGMDKMFREKYHVPETDQHNEAIHPPQHPPDAR